MEAEDEAIFPSFQGRRPEQADWPHAFPALGLVFPIETARALVKSHAVDTTQNEICTSFLFFFVRCGELVQQPAIIELPVSCSFVFSCFFLITSVSL